MRPVKKGWIAVTHCGVCGEDKADLIHEIEGIDVFRCNQCGTVRMSQALDPGSIYDDGYHEGDSWDDPRSDQVWDYTTDFAIAYETYNCRKRLDWLESFRPPGRLLDIGGGIGTFCIEAKARGWQPTLMEPVPSAIEYAREKGIDGIVGGIEDLSTLDRTFDVISMLHVLEHLPEPREALEGCRKALPPGGLVFIEVPHFESVPRRVAKDRWIGWRLGQHIHHFTKQTLHEAFDRAGLEPVSIRSVVQLWEGLIPDYYAYLVGAEGAVKGAARLKRLVAGRDRPNLPGGEGASSQMPPPIGKQPLKRLLLMPPLFAAGKLQELLGKAENLRAVARVRG